jgi:hypothetical protein
MTRFVSLIFCASLGAGLLACGSSTPSGGGTGGSGGGASTSALEIIPASNAVAGWSFDASNSDTANGAATATTQQGTQDLVDGASADFFASPFTPKLFAWETYVNTTFSAADVSPTDTNFPNGATIDVKVLQMPTADQASGLYTALLKASLYVGKTWTEPSSPKVGTDSRVADTGDHWWINFYQGDFYVEVSMGPSYSPAPGFTPGNANTRAAAFAFAAVVAGKI